ncbi:MAG TPA: M14 family metallopeptidase [Candidatus Polarisedimenticolia bacterium]|jgi:murein tripeptide amidase MpaA|nr:M14 family metallopeptidase [Candidatus Polarisedimenticolia bacterium]
MSRAAVVAALVAAGLGAAGLCHAATRQIAPPAVDANAAWATPAEASGFQTTPRYDETIAYLRRLEKASPWIKVTSFGTSPEGRDLVLAVVSKDRLFDPVAARDSGKAIVLLQAGIHAGEIDGKDAGLMLLRDMCVTKTRPALLDRTILLFMPMYNVDGHERFGPYNRINQNGPKEMGWRTTSLSLNLNRDYLKADAVETRAWLKVFTSWWPDLTIDAHVTDGADYRYVVTYAVETGPNVPAPVADWVKRVVIGKAVPAIAADGQSISPYINLIDETDPTKGESSPVTPPRFSTGYTVLQNRPSFLIETHMLKAYEPRVRATYSAVAALMQACGDDAKGLHDAITAAEAQAKLPGRTPLRFALKPATHPVEFKGYKFTREPSPVSGALRIVYGKEPLDLTVPMQDQSEVGLEVDRPRAYLVPRQWANVIEVLKAHGLRLQALTAPVTAAVDGYRLSEPKWNQEPFESHHQVTFKCERFSGMTRTFPVGTVVVPMDQPGSAVAVNLLDPQGVDSFVSWGFFDVVFERKEYAEPYVLEAMAQSMLEKDPALAKEFEAALADPAFASDPRRRLDFFYKRSPFWEDTVGLYPIALVTSADIALPTQAAPGRPSTPSVNGRPRTVRNEN